MGRKILIIEDEADLRELLEDYLTQDGHRVSGVGSTRDAERKLAGEAFDIVFSDIHMPGMTGIEFLEKVRLESEANQKKLPAWVFISADGDPRTVERAVKVGALDVLQKPFDVKTIRTVIDRIQNRSQSPLFEIMDTVQGISGIQLGKEKLLLVETRLLRRARLLGLDTVEQYLEYFRNHRRTEVDELVSLVTTHTTEFFREPDHFDYLIEKLLPKLATQPTIRIWSAAASSGQESFTLAIAVLEGLRELGKWTPGTKLTSPKVEIFGSDIDFNSIERAREGVYEREAVARLPKEIVDRYFDFGSGELEGWVRVKDEVHALCRFEQGNLLGADLPFKDADVIFLRNVLIYFKSEDVAKIVTSLEKSLKPEGVLFLGHSESLTGMTTPYTLIGNAIYMKTAAVKREKDRVAAAKQMGVKPVGASAAATSPSRVFIIDDSVTVRKMLRAIFSKDPNFEVVGEAVNPIEAEKLWPALKPDVITLDIHMPEMDGITYLERLRGREHPPVVMVSSISYDDAVGGLRCFELGAVDYIEKPSGKQLDTESEKIRTLVRAAALSGARTQRTFSAAGAARTKTDDIQYSKASASRDLIAIGASTGGVEALKDVLERFPEETPPIVIVQHIPQFFSAAFAKRLNETCRIEVLEAVDGAVLQPSTAYIAPGGKQMKLVPAKPAGYKIQVTDDAPVNRHKPSVDYLFDSIVPIARDLNVSAAILTGMGGDGARGLKKLRDAGAHTIAQDEDTCVVYGMPKVAAELKAPIEVLPLPSIAYHLFKGLKRAKKSAA